MAIVFLFFALVATPFWLIAYFFFARAAYRANRTWLVIVLHVFTVLLLFADVMFLITMRAGNSTFNN
jgi:RsiW-degrading membrane proteinase PrsW (M82 family)